MGTIYITNLLFTRLAIPTYSQKVNLAWSGIPADLATKIRVFSKRKAVEKPNCQAKVTSDSSCLASPLLFEGRADKPKLFQAAGTCNSALVPSGQPDLPAGPLTPEISR